MVRKMKLKHAVGYENILDEFSVGHCGIKVKVTIHYTLLPKYIAKIFNKPIYIVDLCFNPVNFQIFTFKITVIVIIIKK